MMAMRPPTSPTTVMGGFSFGINTENRRLFSASRDAHGRGLVSESVPRSRGISMLGWMAPVVLTVGGE